MHDISRHHARGRAHQQGAHHSPAPVRGVALLRARDARAHGRRRRQAGARHRRRRPGARAPRRAAARRAHDAGHRRRLRRSTLCSPSRQRRASWSTTASCATRATTLVLFQSVARHGHQGQSTTRRRRSRCALRRSPPTRGAAQSASPSTSCSASLTFAWSDDDGSYASRQQAEAAADAEVAKRRALQPLAWTVGAAAFAAVRRVPSLLRAAQCRMHALVAAQPAAAARRTEFDGARGGLAARRLCLPARPAHGEPASRRRLSLAPTRRALAIYCSKSPARSTRRARPCWTRPSSCASCAAGRRLVALDVSCVRLFGRRRHQAAHLGGADRRRAASGAGVSPAAAARPRSTAPARAATCEPHVYELPCTARQRCRRAVADGGAQSRPECASSTSARARSYSATLGGVRTELIHCKQQSSIVSGGAVDAASWVQFSIRKSSEAAPYVGFQLADAPLFLLESFLVVHNCWKANVPWRVPACRRRSRT
jgi:hypothetical protein